jgi:hypothetical protein
MAAVVDDDEAMEEDEDGSDRRVWTSGEDEAIRAMVTKYGTKSWALIAENLSKEHSIAGRSGKQCRERWHNHLDPHINKSNWTEEEERVMSEAHKELGTYTVLLLKHTHCTYTVHTLSSCPYTSIRHSECLYAYTH